MDIDTVRELFTDRPRLIETLLKIEDKSRNLVPFRLKPIQRDILTTQTGRDIYVKASQIGATTIIMTDYLLDNLMLPGTVSVIIAHEEFITGRLLRKAQFAYDVLHDDMCLPGLPKLHHKSTSEKIYVFEDSQGRVRGSSSFYIGSAKAYVFGIGETIHNLLGDEYAFWPADAPERIMIPAIQRVPLDGRIKIVSTPNGEENDFHNMYKAATDRAGKDVIFTPHFYPWWLDPEYTLGVDSPYALPSDRVSPLELSDDEVYLVSTSNLTEGQIRWRRRKIAELEQMRRSGETRFLFPQLYPEDDVTCFLAVGESYYDVDVIDELARHCYKAPCSFQGTQVWYEPERDVKYLLAIDPGLAKESQTALTVWKFESVDGVEKPIHCATLVGLYTPEVTAQKAKPLARYYNNALIGPEANAHGLALLAHLQDYANIYRRRDIVSGRIGKEQGWLTTPRTKPHMMEELARMLPNMEIHDIRCVSQLRNVRWAGDKVEIIGPDDLHDSMAIGMVCRDSKPIRKGMVGTSGWKW